MSDQHELTRLSRLTAILIMFQSDYEVYGAKAQNPQDAEVDIFVGVN